MKILCLYKECGEFYRLTGIGHAFASAGHDFTFWSPKAKPVFDAFDEFKPDIFIGTTFDLDRATIKCLQQNPQVRVILKGGNWGSLDKAIDRAKFPIVFAEDSDKRAVESIGRPVTIMCHYFPSRKDETMAGWQELGANVLCLPNAADVIDYSHGTQQEQFRCDIAFVGGRWSFKAQNLDKILTPLLHPVGRLNIKLFGNQGWQLTPQFLGFIDTKHIKDIYTSTTVCPNISEPHSTEFGFDVVERPFKIASAGGLCVSDKVSDLLTQVFTEGQCRTFESSAELEDLVHFYKNNKDVADAERAVQRKVVYSSHTYHHRCRDLFNHLGLANEAKKVMSVYESKLLPEDLRERSER